MICVIKNSKVFAIHTDEQVAEIRNKYSGLDIIHVADDTNVTLGGTDPRDSGATWKDARYLLSALELDSPFRIKSAFYSNTNADISVLIASGIGETFSGNTINTINKTSDTTFKITPVSASTTYTIYLKNDGNFASSTDGTIADGSLLIGTISTNADKTVNTIVDKRPLVSGVGEEFRKHSTSFMPHGVDNAGFHNSIYRGKNLGTSVTTKQYTDISNGTFEDMYIGDYWTINSTVYRIAAFNYYMQKGDTATTVNHITLVPDVSMYTHVMNDTDITTGGYMDSKMYTTGLAQAKTTIKNAFSGHVLNHRKLLSNAVTDGKASGWAWVDSEVDLMNEVMVYGSIVWGESTIGGSGYNVGEGMSQLPLFVFRPDMISANRQYFWLRDVVSATYFALVANNGRATCDYASSAYGVRPAFSIS